MNDVDDANQFLYPTIELLRTKDYTNVSKLADHNHLTDDNCHEWKERMSDVFLSCDIKGYISGVTK
jgi:hypothetical protein